MIKAIVSKLQNKIKEILYRHRKTIQKSVSILLSNEQITSVLVSNLSGEILGHLKKSKIFKDKAFGPHLAVAAGATRFLSLENNLDQIRLFLNLENISTRPKVELNDQEKEKILFVTAIFPSIKHAGGLRIFDIIQTLSEKYDVSLYSYYHAEDEPCLNLLKDNLEYVRLVDHSSFSNEDIEHWLKAKNVRFLLAYHVWPEASKLLFTTRNHAKITLFEHSEVVTRSYFADLEKINSDSRDSHFYTTSVLFLQSYVAEYIACYLSDISVCLTDADELFVKDAFNKSDTYLMPTCISNYAVLNKIVELKNINKHNNLSAIFLGYYRHTPNLVAVEWFLSNVLDKILVKVPEFKFKVVGKGNIEHLKMSYQSPAIEWIGEVDDIIPYIQESTICVSPLISGAGFRGKINQYSACKKATVSTTIGVSGLPYTNEKDVLIADNPSDFAEQVILLLSNENMRKTIENNAYDLVKSYYSWDKTLTLFEKHIATYEKSLDTLPSIL